MSKNTWVHDYLGFESILDFDEDWMDAVNSVVPDAEFTGTIRITIEYIPSEEENEPNIQP